jgi:hypothetical protein
MVLVLKGGITKSKKEMRERRKKKKKKKIVAHLHIAYWCPTPHLLSQ